MHRKGLAGPVDLTEARRLLGLAAEQGNAPAQNALATMHVNGQGGPKDPTEAKRLYRLAAAQGHDGAQASLDGVDRLVEAQRVKELADADAMMLQLLAEDLEEKKTKGAAKSKKSTKGKKAKKTCGGSAGTSDEHRLDVGDAGGDAGAEARVEDKNDEAQVVQPPDSGPDSGPGPRSWTQVVQPAHCAPSPATEPTAVHPAESEPVAVFTEARAAVPVPTEPSAPAAGAPVSIFRADVKAWSPEGATARATQELSLIHI